MTSKLSAPAPHRQLAFYQLLVGARKNWLSDALSDALKLADPIAVKAELAALVPADVQKILAAAGIRDEHVFPCPTLLLAKPTLVGYYRLLLGSPQKTFYAGVTGMGAFKSMETRNASSKRQQEALPDFCSAMSLCLAELIRQASPSLTLRDIGELPLLTLGSQFQGGNNNLIGQQATVDVFLSIVEIVKTYIEKQEDKKIVLKNAAGRKVTIQLASDPDVCILEEVGGALHRKVAIEIKGGLDKSNAHNRAGEAEKSHQKARNDKFRDFWTIIAKSGLDIEKLKSESPTTTSWFDVAQILEREGPDWKEFRSRIISETGIPFNS